MMRKLLFLIGILAFFLSSCENNNANKFTVTFHSNGGIEVESIIINDGNTIPIPFSNKEGYTLDGWYTSLNNGLTLDEKWSFTNNIVNNNITLYAKWYINQYTISFETNEGSQIPSITQDYGTNIEETPIKKGFTFNGWYLESDFITPINTIPAENILVYAKWTINQYTITFDSVGGTAVDSITQDYGSAITSPADPTKEGYLFSGWEFPIPDLMPPYSSTIKATWIIIVKYDIETPEDFFAMANNSSGNYVLKNDIDFTGVEFVTPFTSSFKGSFEGNGFTLSNINITESKLYNGVFGYITSGTVKNLHIDNLIIGTEENPIITTSSTKTGFLTGYQASSLSVIENVVITNAKMFLSTSSSTYTYIGGIAGESRGRIENVTVENSTISLHTTSNSIVRLGGGVGYGYESLQASQLHINVDITFELEADITTRSNRAFSIYIGGLMGDVDQQATTLGSLEEMIYEGSIILSKIDYNTNENDEANYTLHLGGAFGVVNRSFDNIYIDATIDLTIEPIDVQSNISQTLRVGGFAGLANTYDIPEHIVLNGGSITLNFDTNQIQARIASFIALSRGASIKGFTLSPVVIEGATVDAALNLNSLQSLTNFFDSEFLNKQLLES